MLNNLISIDSSDASEDNPNRSKSFLNPNLTNLKKKYSIHENIENIGERRETIYEMKLRENLIDLGSDIFSISNEDISKHSEFFESFGITDDKKVDRISVRHWLEISNDEFEEFKKSIIDETALENFYKEIDKEIYNFKTSNCGFSVGGIKSNNSCTGYSQKPLIKNNNQRIFIDKYRKIYGDGNCFYRAVMFRYLEILVLNNKIEILQNFVYDVYNSFNSKELKSRIKNSKVNTKNTIILLIQIIYLLKKKDIISAHKILIKSFGLYQSFDHSIIYYFRYILYDYIKNNENKKYKGQFPMRSLLPRDYEGKEFAFVDFYRNELLELYSFAESIIIYVTPNVLGIYLNVINFNYRKEEYQERFDLDGQKGLNLTDEITVVLKDFHYQIIYTENDIKKIYQIYQEHGKQLEEEEGCACC